MGWTIHLDGHTATVNQLMRTVIGKIRLTKRDRRWVYAACLSARVPTAERKRRVTLLVTLRPRQRAADPDAYWKSLLDALVCCGALVNDSRKWVELAPVEYTRGRRPAMTVTLEDCRVT